MKKYLVFIILFFSTFLIFAEGFVEIGFIKNDSYENGGLPFIRSIAGGKEQPYNLLVDEYEGMLYYSVNFDIHRISMDNFLPIPFIHLEGYNSNPVVGMLSTNLKVFLLHDGYVTDGFDLIKDFEDIIFSDLPGGQYGGAINIGKYLFYYSGSNNLKGPIRAVSLDGEELSTEQAINQLQIFTEALSDEEQEAILPIHKEKLESGNSILVGNRYYTYKIGDLLDYFEDVYGIDYHEDFQKESDAKLLNYDMDGNSYWYYPFHFEDGSAIFCFSPTGEMLQTADFTISIQTTEIDPAATRRNPGGVFYFYVVPSGNIYFSITNGYGTILFRYNRTWGDPNMVALAINGLDGTDYDDYVYQVLDGFSTEELRLQRNMVFALKDYRFSSTDLLEYYGQFNWYDPEKTIDEASAELTDNQLRFVNYIRELEAARN